MNQNTELKNRIHRRVTKGTSHVLSIPQENKPVFLSKIVFSLLPLASIAILYLFGMSIHDGYLSVFHVSSSLFPQSREESLLIGSMGLVLLLFKVLLVALLLFLGFIVMMSITALTFKQLKKLRKNTFQFIDNISGRIKRNTLFKMLTSQCPTEEEAKPFSEVADRAFYIYIKFSISLVLCIAFIGLIYYVSDDGSSMAKKHMEDFTNGKYESAVNIKYSKYPDGIQAMQIACNSIKCAFWSPAEGTFYLRHEQIESTTVPSMEKTTTTEEQTPSKP
ncbi:hypothetical protein [Aeromonas eucrenophila]|uniref:Uncharacterized protein n=1 Tax=Aeromonas eucrenophila TaxID=649 RepID=A0ABW0Y6L5_9GAMM|nr:hypothetical protein [Aeromonas eucrenophila]